MPNWKKQRSKTAGVLPYWQNQIKYNDRRFTREAV